MLLKKLVLVAVLTTLAPTGAVFGQNVLHYLELRDIGATPAEIVLSPDYQTIIEFEGLSVSTASSGRADQITFENDEQTIRLRANQDIVNTDLTVRVGGKTALFTLRSDPSTTAPRRYIVRDTPLPPLQSLSYEGIEGKTDLNSLSIGTKDEPPGVSLALTVTRNQKNDVVIQYELVNDGEVAIVNEPSRLTVLNEDIKLRYTLSRVPPAGSVNVVRPGESEYGTLIVSSPPTSGILTFLWVMVQLGPGGHYAVTRNLTELLEGTGQDVAATPNTLSGTTATTITPTPTTEITTSPTPTVAPVDTTAALASAGVTLYQDTDFSGAAILLAGRTTSTFYQADQFGEVGDNAVSSLIVPNGYMALLCDVQATPPCQQYGPGTYNVEPSLNDVFSFAQIFATSSLATTPSDNPAPSVQALPGDNLIINPTFDTNADGWWLWVNSEENAKAQNTIRDGRYCVTIASSINNAHSVVLGQGHVLEPNQPYTLAFDYQADRVTKFSALYINGEDPWTEYFNQEVTADAGVQHFEGSFTPTASSPKANLQFNLGGADAGTTICLDNITLTAATQVAEAPPAEPTRAETVQVNETQTEALPAVTAITPEAGGTYSIAAKHSNFCADVLGFEEANGSPVAQHECNGKTNQQWTLQAKGDYYQLVVGHNNKCLEVWRASSDEGAAIQQWECVGADNQLWSLQPVDSGYQLVAKHSGKCLNVSGASMDSRAPLIQYSCTNGRDQLNDTFLFSVDAPVIPATPAPETPEATTPPSATGDNLVENSSFDEPLSTTWESGLFEGARSVAKIVDGEYCFNSLNGGPFTNATRLIQMNRPLESEQTYLLSFEAYADKPRTISSRVGQNYEPWTLHHQEYFTLQETKQSYTMAFKMPAIQDPSSYLEFAMGGKLGSNPPFRVCFDNVSLHKAEAGTQPSIPNVLGNPAFDDTVGSLWQGWFDGGGGSQGLSAVSKGEFCIKVTNGGANNWGAQVTQREFPLEANQAYTLSFEAYADQPHTIHAKVGQGYEPWGVFHEQNFDIGQQKQPYTFSFTMPATGEGNSGLEFWMGGELATNPPFTMCFDNLVLKAEGQPTSQKPETIPEERDSVNLIRNANFDDASGTGWKSRFHAESGARGSSEIKAGEYCLNLINGGTARWNSQLIQRGFALEANQSYSLRFEAYAHQPHAIVARVAQSQGQTPRTVFTNQNVELSQEKQTYALSFTMPKTGDSNGGLEFWLGGDLATNSPFTVCFDNVVLKANLATASQ